LNGKDYYLGAYGSAGSRAEYDRLINEWLAHARPLHGVWWPVPHHLRSSLRQARQGLRSCLHADPRQIRDDLPRWRQPPARRHRWPCAVSSKSGTNPWLRARGRWRHREDLPLPTVRFRASRSDREAQEAKTPQRRTTAASLGGFGPCPR